MENLLFLGVPILKHIRVYIFIKRAVRLESTLLAIPSASFECMTALYSQFSHFRTITKKNYFRCSDFYLTLLSLIELKFSYLQFGPD